MSRDERNYWQRRRFLGRYSRRTVLRGGAVAGAGVTGMALVGCGNDDDDGNGNGGNGGQTPGTTPQNGASPTTGATPAPGNGETPRTGGIWESYALGEAPSLDPLAPVTFGAGQILAFVYPELVRQQAGPGIDPALYQPTPDLAESVERSPDGLTYTVKIRPEARWHPPVDRPVDAEDVVYSFQRYSGQLDLPRNPGMNVLGLYLPDDGVEAVDESTVVFNLSRPQGDFLSGESMFIYIMPREAGQAFDPVNEMVGAGPWMQESYTPGTVLQLRKNPDWHFGPELPYMDGVNINFIPEYATRLSQFLTGALDECDLQGVDLERVQAELPDAQILVRAATLPASYITFEGEDRAPDAPWRDPRVRAAISMAVDRDGLLEVAYNTSQVADMGFPVELRWNNDIPSFATPYWLDPKNEFHHAEGDPAMTPENQERFQFSPENAKAALEAAGYPDGFSTNFITTSSGYGAAFNTQSEVIFEQLRQIGLDLTYDDQDYAAEYVSSTAAQGEFTGMAHIPRGFAMRSQFSGYLIPGASRNNGHINDQEFIDMVAEIEAEADPEQARILMLEAQNRTNEKMYYVPMQLGASGDYFAYSPRARNVAEYQISGYLVGDVQHSNYWLADQ